MSITKAQLHLAGWLSITNAAVTIPALVLFYYQSIFEFILSFVLPVPSTTILNPIIKTLIFLRFSSFICVLFFLKKLLNQRFQFNKANLSISVLMVLEIIFSVLSFWLIYLNTSSDLFLTNFLNNINNIQQEAALVSTNTYYLSVIFNIVYMVFAANVLGLSNNLYGLLKPFAYTSIASGLCLATIILIPLGLLIGAASNVILGIIFFRAAEQI